LYGERLVVPGDRRVEERLEDPELQGKQPVAAGTSARMLTASMVVAA
jgi:hypothetical protein